MRVRGHLLVGGVAAGIVVAQLPAQLPPLPRASIIALCLLGALAPDLDTTQSTLGRWCWPVILLGHWALSNPLTWLACGRRRVRRVVGHRGFSHSLLACVLVTLLVTAGIASAGVGVVAHLGEAARYVALGLGRWTLAEWAIAHGAAFFVGAISHCAADMCTEAGVPFLYPWIERRFGFGPRFLRPRMR